jgi:hypothetical protein
LASSKADIGPDWFVGSAGQHWGSPLAGRILGTTVPMNRAASA